MALRAPNKTKGANLKEPAEPAKPAEKEHLTVSLRYLRPSHCISVCERDDVLSFVEKIRILTSKSWMEIGTFPRHGLGYEKIARTSLQVQIPDHVTPDVNILATGSFSSILI